ncbi:iron-sulfur cluster repair di-iron protein [Bacillus sp. Marseille-P3661]|uniref:iron-sulfur cluster repair di-iron protein n=1 Tax=Bacillus sp. Marseille-P3661 TaxID=1936234 RepID=UPI000C855CAD|nr:iron-sulfur cluster repair di-iron protein [Bacillus sp. Marseille-P3661]
MLLKINSEMNVGDIVTAFPQAADLFKKYRIDFCCGGNQPLKEVIKEKELNEQEIVDQLNDSYSKAQTQNGNEVNWSDASNLKIIDHVIHTHHAFLNEELPQLGQFVTKVYRVHGMNHPHLAEVYNKYHDLKKELIEHLIKEEQSVFPLIKDYDENPSSDKLESLKKAIIELESEHDQAGDLLKQIRELTNDFTLPPGACMTYTLTYQRLEALETDMFTHVHLENNILFPRILSM